MASEEIFSQLSMVSKLRIFVFNLTPFNSNLSYLYLCVDPNLYSENESGSTKLLYGSKLDPETQH